MNSLFVASVGNFNKEGSTHDKNGHQNLWLSPLAGKIPNRAMILGGTIAVNQNVIAGKSYLFSCTEGEVDEEFGRQFNVIKVSDITPLEIMDSVGKLGKAVIVDVSATAETTEEVSEEAAALTETPTEF